MVKALMIWRMTTYLNVCVSCVHSSVEMHLQDAQTLRPQFGVDIGWYLVAWIELFFFTSPAFFDNLRSVGSQQDHQSGSKSSNH